jgi:histidinol-phosphate aminotransferase
LKALDPLAVYAYPHGAFLQDAIVKFWAPHAALGRENIVLTNGSIDGIYLANTAFAAPGAAVLTVRPQFSDYVTHAKFMNIEYRPAPLDAAKGYRIETESVLEQILEKIDDSLSLVYLDNPNNPTGQAVSRDFVIELLEKSARRDVCVIADEAYADFMEESQSAVTLLPEYENLIVLRTFSKGWGLAGLRAGYLLAHEAVCADLRRLSNPYAVSQPARIAAAAALSQPAFLRHCRSAVARSKIGLRQKLGKNLVMAHTLDTCPICLLSHADDKMDLADEFFRRGVLTYSGASFDGLGKYSVRLRVPREEECEKVFAAAAEIGAYETNGVRGRVPCGVWGGAPRFSLLLRKRPSRPEGRCGRMETKDDGSSIFAPFALANADVICYKKPGVF